MEEKHPKDTQQSSLFETKKKVKEKSYLEEVVSETKEKPMCALENHSWRDAYLKNIHTTRHVVFCTGCTRTKFNDDGTIQQWLLDQGYIKRE